jgi:hypothetical protein
MLADSRRFRRSPAHPHYFRGCDPGHLALTLPVLLMSATGEPMFMRDVIADWNRWSRGERLFAGALMAAFSLAFVFLTLQLH